jgi:opacity protein-like surface antigen
MRAVTLSIPVAALALCLGAAQLPAQQPGNGAFQWYVGGSGGILNFRTATQGYSTVPMGGAHLLITARRTGLLLSVEQAFGSNETSAYTFQEVDSTGTVVSSASVPVVFDHLRKYSATLVAFPIKGPITPYFGIGVGILHTVGHDDPDDGFARAIGSSGFGSLMGGLNFRVGPLSAFGQYQITTGPSTQVFASFIEESKTTLFDFGHLIDGPTHTFSTGLRFSLGNARERATGGGY